MSKIATLKTVAAAAGVCAALFAAGTANAYVYGVSSLNLNNLTILATGANGNLNVAQVKSYSFEQLNTSSINGVNGPTNSTSAKCGSSGIACNPAGPVLDSAAANAAGSTIVRGANDYSQLGFGNPTASYANANSVLKTAELVQGLPTSSTQIAEALLNINGKANAGALQTSFSALTTTFALSGNSTSLSINFLADLFLNSAINGLTGAYESTANSTVTATLTKAGGGGSIIWSPNGSLTSGCEDSMGTGSCVETADAFNLQKGTSAGFNPDSDLFSASGAFGVTFKDLVAGNYTLTLVSNTVVNMNREVPEPAGLALLGIALAGLAFTSKRQGRKQA